MNRASLAAKIKALLSKTVENGCTEAEAMSAASAARSLMDRYHLDHGTLGMEEEGTNQYHQPFQTNKLFDTLDEVKFGLLLQVMKFTDTKGWRTRGIGFTFFGLKSDTDFAAWLLESLSTFVIQKATSHVLTAALFSNTRVSESSFITGCVDRINERLKAMTRERAGTGSGRELIPLKNQIVTRDFDKLGIKLGYGRSANFGNDRGTSGYAAGRAAGDSASFGRPVTTRNSGLLGRS